MLIESPISQPVKEREAVLNCEHCGLPLPESAVVRNNHSFCCSGCATVFSLLNDLDMCEYYGDGAGLRPEQVEAGEFESLNKNETETGFIVFQDADTKQYKFRLPSIHCKSCVFLLEKLYKFNPGIKNSRIDFFQKELLVTVAKGKVQLSEIAALLKSLGYTPDLSLSSEYGKQKKILSPRVINLGVAGFCFGNIMILSFPEYFGLSEEVLIPVLRTL